MENFASAVDNCRTVLIRSPMDAYRATIIDRARKVFEIRKKRVDRRNSEFSILKVTPPSGILKQNEQRLPPLGDVEVLWHSLRTNESYTPPGDVEGSMQGTR